MSAVKKSRLHESKRFPFITRVSIKVVLITRLNSLYIVTYPAPNTPPKPIDYISLLIVTK